MGLTPETINLLIVALGGLVTISASAWVSVRTQHSSAKLSALEAANKQIALQDERIVRLEQRLNERDARIDELNHRVDELETLNAQKDLTIATQARRISELESEVYQLKMKATP